MANGSHREGPARADRLREENAKHARYLQRMLDEERSTKPGTQPYREEFDSVSEVTAGPDGLKAKGIPREGWKVISWGFAIGMVLIASAILMLAWKGMR